jgi:hypothetical protein
MFCIKCGTENPEYAKFCKKCGMNLDMPKDFRGYYEEDTPKSIKKGISLLGIVIGNTFYFIAALILSALWIAWIAGSLNMEKINAASPSDYDFIIFLIILMILTVISGILASYFGGKKYINGVLNGFLGTVFALIFIGIIADGALFIIWPLLFGLFGIFGGILGVFIKKR